MIKNDLANLLERKANFSRAKANLTVKTILETMKKPCWPGKNRNPGVWQFPGHAQKQLGRDIKRNRQILIQAASG